MKSKKLILVYFITIFAIVLVNITYTLNITYFDYHCRDFVINISKNLSSNSSYIEIFYYNSTGLSLLTSFWLNNSSYKEISLSLPLDNVNTTIVVRETFNISNTTIIETKTETIPTTNLIIKTLTTENKELSGYDINLTIECLNNQTFSINTTTILTIIGGGKVWINSYPQIYQGRVLKNISKPLSFTLLNATENLIFYYKTLLNLSELKVIIDNNVFIPPFKVYLFSNSNINISLKIVSETNNLVTEPLHVIIKRYNLTTEEEIYNGTVVNGYLNLTVSQPYGAYKYIVTILDSENYNFTVFPEFEIDKQKVYFITNDSVAYIDYYNGTVSCSYISSIGWKSFIETTGLNTFILKSGLYDPEICGKEFFNLSNLKDLTIIGENKTNVLIGGYYNASFLEKVVIISSSLKNVYLSIVKIYNSSNIRLYNISFIEYGIKENIGNTIDYYYEWLVYIVNSSNITIDNSLFISYNKIYREYPIGLHIKNSTNIFIKNSSIKYCIYTGIEVVNSFVNISYVDVKNVIMFLYIYTSFGKIDLYNVKLQLQQGEYNLTIKVSEPIDYNILYPYNVSVYYNGIYNGKIIRIENYTEVIIKNSSFYEKIHKLIAINITNLYINDSTFYFDTEKLILLSCKNVWLYNVTFNKSVISPILIYPKLNNIVFKKVKVYSLKSVILQNVINVLINNSEFSVDNLPHLTIMIDLVNNYNISIINTVFLSSHEGTSHIEFNLIPLSSKKYNVVIYNCTFTALKKITQIIYLSSSMTTISNYKLNIEKCYFNNSEYLIFSKSDLYSSFLYVYDSQFQQIDYIIYFNELPICNLYVDFTNNEIINSKYLFYLDKCFPPQDTCKSSFYIANTTYTEGLNGIYIDNIQGSYTIEILNTSFDNIRNSIGEIKNIKNDVVITINKSFFKGMTTSTTGFNITNARNIELINNKLIRLTNAFIIENCDSVTLNYSSFEKILHNIIKVKNSTKITIENTKFGNNILDYGVNISKSDYVILKNLIFINDTYSNLTTSRLIFLKNISHVIMKNITVLANSGVATIWVAGFENIRVEDIKIKNYIENRVNITYGIYISTGRDAIIKNLSLNDISKNALTLVGIVNFTIDNVTIYNFGKEAYDYGFFYSTLLFGAGVSILAGMNGKISNIKINYSDMRGIEIVNSYNVELENINATNYCKFFGDSGPSVTCQELIYVFNSYYITVNNVIGTDIGREFIKINNSENVKVKNISGKDIGKEYYYNYIHLGKYDIYLLLKSKHFIVDLDDEKIHNTSKPSFNAITILSSSNVVIENFYFNNIGKNGIDIADSRAVTIRDGLLILDLFNISLSQWKSDDFSIGVNISSSDNTIIYNVTIFNYTLNGVKIDNRVGSIILDKININTTKAISKYIPFEAIKITNSNLQTIINNTTIFNLSYSDGIFVYNSKNVYFNNLLIRKVKKNSIVINLSENISFNNVLIINVSNGVKIMRSGSIYFNIFKLYNCSYTGIWILSLYGALNLNNLDFQQVYYPLFLDDEYQPPRNGIDISLINVNNFYVKNIFDGILYDGYIIFIRDEPGFLVSNNLYNGKKVYAVYIKSSSGKIENSNFNWNGNLIYITDSDNILIINTSLNNSLHGMDIYDSSNINIFSNSIKNSIIYGIFGYNISNLNIDKLSEDTVLVNHLIKVKNIVLNNSFIYKVNTTTQIEFGENVTIENSQFKYIYEKLPRVWTFSDLAEYRLSYLTLTNLTYVFIYNNVFEGNNINEGVYMYLVNHTTFDKNIFENNKKGIFEQRSYYTDIISSTFVNNTNGIELSSSYFYRASVVQSYDISEYFKDYAPKFIKIINSRFIENKNGVKITGASNINISNSNFTDNEYGINITSYNWGLSYCDCGDFGICEEYWYQPVSNVTILNCLFNSTNISGIYINSISFTDHGVMCGCFPGCRSYNYRYPYLINNISIKNCKFIKNNNALESYYNILLKIENSTFSNNINCGIKANNNRNIFIYYSRFEYNGFAIQIILENNLAIQNSYIFFNDNSIYIDSGSGEHFINNTIIQSNNETGVYIKSSTLNLLSLNNVNILNNNGKGIFIYRSNINNFIINSTLINYNIQEGINGSLSTLTNVTISNSIVSNNERDGIIFDSKVNNVRLFNLSVSYNNGSGINFTKLNNGNVIIYDVIVNNNNDHGLFFNLINNINYFIGNNISSLNNNGYGFIILKGYSIDVLNLSDIRIINDTRGFIIYTNCTYYGIGKNILISNIHLSTEPGLVIQSNNILFKNTTVMYCIGGGILLINSRNISFVNLSVIKNQYVGVYINNTDVSIENASIKYNTLEGVVVFFSNVTINYSNISWNGAWGISVNYQNTYHKVIVNHSYICMNTNGSSWDISNSIYTVSFLAVLNSWFGGTNPENPYLTFLVANKYMNAYPDNNYFCNYTKRGISEFVSSTTVSNLNLTIIPYLPRAKTYIITAKGNNLGAVILVREIYFEPIVEYPTLLGSGKFIIIVKNGKVYVA